MNLFTIGFLLNTMGEIAIGFAVFMVHMHVFKERKIDADVLRTMKKERTLTIAGIFMIVAGTILQLMFRLK
ncbi:MAG: hypothetical protein HY453_02025 [Parcubacteria group bacterium]|nr:hypothetical protein [Parcubacteria group bacterium]